MAAEVTARERLLEAIVGYIAEHGVGDLSLRTLAAGVGSSHRMLIYHFGSKEGVLTAVVEAVEKRQRQAVAEIEIGEDADAAAWALWKRWSDPSLAPFVKLFFELSAHAIQGRPHARPLLDSLVEPWIGLAAEIHVQRGLTRSAARAEARLGVAVVRGLLLDLLATGDRRGVDQAMRRYISKGSD
jgi:AcrR family transcriptional regulator